MIVISYIVLFVFVALSGAAIGSFLAATVVRNDPEGKNKKLKDSKWSLCDHCHKKLNWSELIPIFSYIMQKGKCKGCGERIESTFFFMELICAAIAIIFTSIYFENLDVLLLTRNLLIAYGFVYLAYYDLLYWEVPLKFTIGFIATIFVLDIVLFGASFTQIISNLLSGTVGVLVIVALIIVSKGKGLGLGDAWVFGGVGIMFGWEGLIVTFLMATFSGSIIGLIKVYLIDKKIKGVIIQFIPFIAFGAILNLIYGDFLFGLMFPYLYL